ncbi:hypothetical protein BC832DRAFT_369645 [Gaertneriomyces semiglobifer]|nr:hypothetical protein BC832DRAFT_369645 [Gaertneriomyces semiglobifer]
MQCKFVTYALWPYEAQTEEELSFQENDILLVTDVEDEGWWIAVPKSADTFGDAKRGLVPTSYLQELEPIVCATSIYPYDAATDDELSFPEGATLTVYDTSDPDWWFAKYENQVGLVPKTYVEADGDVPVQEAAPPVDHVSTPAPQPQPQPQQQATVADGKNPEAQKKQLLSALDGLGFQSRKSSSKGSIENLAPTDIVYWNITEIDKKKKKNSSKGQMGVTDDFIIYFVSDDANRDIIARWELAEVTGISEKKGKRLLLEIAGDEHQFEGDKADIQGLLARLQNMQNKRKLAAAGGPMSPAALPTASTIPAPRAQAVAQQPPPQPPRSFAPPEVKTEVPPTVQFQLPAQVAAPASDGGPKIAVALYDYEAQGADELSIKENDNLAVLDDSDPEWWKVRLVSKRGGGGLVPASYVQLKRRLDEQGTPSSQVDARIVDADNQRRQQEENHRRQQEELERQRQEQERKHREQEEARQREEEQRRRREEQERRTREEAEQRRKAEEEMRRVPQATASASARQVPTHAPTRPAPSVPGPPKMPPRPDMHAPRPEKPNHPPQTTPHAASSGNGTVRNVPKAETDKPNLSKIRTWTDRSGSFRVEAEFLNVGDGKVHLHKVNGVKIAVPLSKLDPKDVEFIRSLPGHSHIQAPAAQAAVPPPRLGVTNDILAAARNVPVPDAPEGPVSYNGFNWKEFLVKAGVAPGDSSMYAQKFVQEKMDRSHLADMDRSLLRGLGVAEGDILRITKAGKAQAIPAVSLAAVQELSGVAKEYSEIRWDWDTQLTGNTTSCGTSAS